ncbi:hypothetical protein, partial [Haloarcula marismortui]|uniref:hypothetical protein n=1 Tax=Haloarcula marismortui TaxID=2238 RepID=UPI0019D3A98C
YSVISLLCSAYYSTKALQMRPYSAYFTADAIQKRIQDGCRDDTKVVKELLVGKKKNEEHNIEKSNYISVSESCSLNGLIGLGVGFGLTAVLSLPLV